MNQIHPTAIIGSDVTLGQNVSVGPYTVLSGKIEIGDNCQIAASVHIMGDVKIGEFTAIHSFTAIGDAPQDYSFDGSPGLIEIGKNCKIREGVTIHTPVNKGVNSKTLIDNNVFIMTNSHVGHNSRIGEYSTLASGCLLAGHVEIENHVFVSGNVAIHQFCRVGSFSIIGGLGKTVQDVPPYSIADGNPLMIYGLNIVGLRRNEFSQEQRNRIKDVFKIYFSKKSRNEALALIDEKYPNDPIIQKFTRFVRESKRGITKCYHSNS